MNNIFSNIYAETMALADVVAKEEYQGMTEEDLDTLAEAIETLNDLYETLYDEVFVESEDVEDIE
jgi:hypothetical protein